MSLLPTNIGAQLVKVAFPREVASPSADGFLVFHLDEQFEGEFDDFLLGGESGDFEGIGDEGVIDFDVGFHGFGSIGSGVVCKLMQVYCLIIGGWDCG